MSSVLLSDPETPVMAVSRPSGRSMARGCTVIAGGESGKDGSTRSLERIRSTFGDHGAALAARAGADLDKPLCLEAVARYGLCIVMLDEDSDAYPLVVVPAENTVAITALAQSLGREARVPQ